MTLVLFFRGDETEVRGLAASGAFFLSPADGLVAFSFGAAGTIEREREDRGTLEPRAAAALLALFRGDEAEVRGLAARGAFFLSPADGLLAFSFGAAGTIEREREDRGTLEPRAAGALLALFRGDEAEVRGLAARGAFFLSPADGLVAFASRRGESRAAEDLAALGPGAAAALSPVFPR